MPRLTKQDEYNKTLMFQNAFEYLINPGAINEFNVIVLSEKQSTAEEFLSNQGFSIFKLNKTTKRVFYARSEKPRRGA